MQEVNRSDLVALTELKSEDGSLFAARHIQRNIENAIATLQTVAHFGGYTNAPMSHKHLSILHAFCDLGVLALNHKTNKFEFTADSVELLS